MFGRMMNNYYYGKSGKGDFRKEDLPTTRSQLFRDTLRTRFAGLVRLNLLYCLIWIPAMIVIYIFSARFYTTLNDIALYSMDECMANWAKLVANIRQVNPDMDIYIQSGTPIYYKGETGDLTNARMDEYNGLLKTFAENNGCVYVELAAKLKDSNNGLAKAYCSDDFVHFTDPGCALWISILKELV